MKAKFPISIFQSQRSVNAYINRLFCINARPRNFYSKKADFLDTIRLQTRVAINS